MTDIVEATAPSRVKHMIAWLAVAAFASSANIRITDSLLPMLARDYETTPGAASTMVAAYAIAYGLLQMVWGPLGDRYGKMRVVMVGILCSAIACVACAAAPSLTVLTGLRFAAGAFAAAIIPLSLAYIGDSVPYERRQNTIARFLLGVTFGLIFGQSLGGVIAEHLGWRAVFLSVTLLFLAAAAGVWLEMGRAPKAESAAPPSLGTAFLNAARLLKLKEVRGVILSVGTEGMLIIGAFTFLGAHMHDRFGMGLDAIGLTLAFYGVGGALYALASPVFIGLLGERGLVIGGGLVLAAGFAGAALAGHVSLFGPVAFLVGLGFMMLHNTLQTRATQMAPANRGGAIALFASFFFIGQTIGVSIAGRAYDAYGAVPGFVVAAIGLPLLGLLVRLTLLRRPAGG